MADIGKSHFAKIRMYVEIRQLNVQISRLPTRIWHMWY